MQIRFEILGYNTPSEPKTKPILFPFLFYRSVPHRLENRANMPPNRKTDLSSQDFASLDVAALLQTFKVVVDVPQPQQQQPSTTTISYWDWPTAVVVVDDDETKIECLNTGHIESNLVKEAQRLQEKIQTAVQSSQARVVEESDSYWDMPTVREDLFATLLETNTPQNTSTRPAATHRHHHPAPTDAASYLTNYWDNAAVSSSSDADNDDYWNDPAHSHYHKILVTRKSRRVAPTYPQQQHHAAPVDLDRDSYWDESPATTTTNATSYSDTYWNDPAESHNKQQQQQQMMKCYWDWPSSFPAAKQEQQELQVSLDCERAHRMTTADFVEKQLLLEQAKCHQHLVARPVLLVAAHDDYWAH